MNIRYSEFIMSIEFEELIMSIEHKEFTILYHLTISLMECTQTEVSSHVG